MPAFCIPKNKIDKLKIIFRNLGENQLQKLADMSPERRIKLFSKQLDKDEAVLLNQELERSIASEKASALKNFVRNNLDRKYREAKIDRNQLASIKRYIDARKYPVKRRIEITSIKDLLKMSDQKQLGILKRLMSRENAIKTQKEIQKLYSSDIEKSIADKLENFKGLNNFDKFIDKKIDLLAEQKAGIAFTNTESETVFKMAKDIADKKALAKKTGKRLDRTQYGASKVALNKYMENLKNPDKTLKDIFGSYTKELKASWKEDKITTVADVIKKTARTIADNSVEMVASWDNSFLGRQGLHTLETDLARYAQAKKAGIPYKSIWWNMAKKSFVDFARTVGGKNTEDALAADIFSRENYELYKQAKILPKMEEETPSTLLRHAPGVGRLFKASDIAFNGSAIRARTSLFDFYKKLADSQGVITTDKIWLENVGKMINALTARGQWGKRGEPAIVRVFMWAPKMLKGNWDVLTAHTLGTGLKTTFARKQSALNLLSVIGSTAIVLGIAKEMKPDSVTFDTNSSDFGKIKVGKTRIDTTGGAGSLIVLASRMLTGEYTSSKTGIKYQLGSKFGQQSRFDVIMNFLVNKTPPSTRVIADILRGRNYKGEKPTAKGELYEATTPISVQNIISLKDNHSADAVAGVILDALGFNSTTYEPRKTSWCDSTSKEMKRFKDLVGAQQFKEANAKYDRQVNKRIEEIIKSPEFKKKSNEDKRKTITKAKDTIKKTILREYKLKALE